jgi:hypothetical protein
MGRFAELRAHARRLPVLRHLIDLRLQLIALSILFILTLWGTLYQVEAGLWASQQRFFHSWYFLVGGLLPFPGAKLVLTYLFISLFLVMILRLSYRLEKTGIILIHLGLLVLLAGAGFTHLFAVESFISLREGEGGNLATDTRAWEISVWRESMGESNQTATLRKVEAIDLALLIPGRPVIFSNAGLTLIPRRIFPHCRPASDPSPTNGGLPSIPAASIAPRSLFQTLAPPVDPAQAIPGCEFTLLGGGKTNMASRWGGEPEALIFGDCRILLRRKCHELPATLALRRFTKETHPGTSVARRYESRLLMVEKGLSRDVVVSMNEPLRFADVTVYQSSYSEDEGVPVSTFAVVKNVGRAVPYAASLLLFLGMLIHFGILWVGRMRSSEAP